jgi:HlyD family secretion protein
MTLRRKIIILALAAAVGGGYVASRRFGEKPPVQVFTEPAAARDLESVVRESGRVRAKQTVPLSANTIGQVLDVSAREGETVKAGQLLIQIDPTPFLTAIAQGEAALKDAETRLGIARAQPERTRRKLERERALGESTSVERIDELSTDLDVQVREVEAAELRVASERARLERDRHELTKVRITAPIDGVVLRVNVEKGQNVVMGTMNNAGTELMTVADLSTQEVELEVGEAAILDLALGQTARVEVDALRDRKLKGRLTEIGTSPLASNRPGAGAQERSVVFRAVVTLDEVVPGVRPGFSASAEIVTATRTAVLSVPIRALVARELPVDENDRPLPPPPPPPEPPPFGAAFAASPPEGPSAPTATASQRKKVFEGVMRVADGKASFVPVKIGVSGKEHVEVLEGVAAGDELVTGPYKALRELKEGDRVERRPEGAEGT